ncbi:MAG TPA: hypothetical protein VGA30_09195 [Actinomycetota bacterium]
MTMIRTTCPTCGAVEMGVDAVMLSFRQESGEGSYRFLCPGCMSTVEKPADQKIVALLLSVGVDVEGLDAALAGFDGGNAARNEIALLETRPDGPPLTVDDLISFHFLLEDDARLARALAYG